MVIRLEHFVREFSKWLALLGLLGLVALALVTIADVMMRWLFASPIDGVSDLYRLIIAVVVASFFPSAFAERSHIAIHFLSAILRTRGRRIMAAFAALVTFGYACVLAWQLVRYTGEVYATGETTWLLGISVTPWWMAATAFIVLCVPVQLVVFMVEASGRAGDAANDPGASSHNPASQETGV